MPMHNKLRLEWKRLRIPFRSSFRHASASREDSYAVWVQIHDAKGHIGYGEGCPRPYVTGESMGSCHRFLQSFSGEIESRIHDVDSLRNWVLTNRETIDKNPAAWCAMELALLDLLGKREGVPVETLLGLRPLRGPYRYTAVLSILPEEGFSKQIAQYAAAGFRDYKIKLSGESESDQRRLQILQAAVGKRARVRADLNNLWKSPDEAIRHLGSMGISWYAVEEPLRSGDFSGMLRVARQLDTRIVLDESFLREEDFKRLPDPPGLWMPNIRVSKMGGLVRTMGILEEAKKRNVRVIIGAQVGETSILTRAALAVAEQAGSLSVAQEGAFGTHLLQFDVSEPPLMFDKGGALSIPNPAISSNKGWGLNVKVPPECLIHMEE